MNNIHLFIMCVCIVLIPFRFSLAITFPTQDGSADDFSSPFGPRDLGYYDYHEGLDIGNVNSNPNVRAASGGIVTKFSSSIIIENGAGTDHYLKYLPIDSDPTIETGSTFSKVAV